MNTWLSLLVFFFSSSTKDKPLEIKYETGATDEISLLTDNSGALILKVKMPDNADRKYNFIRVNADFSDTLITPEGPAYKKLTVQPYIEQATGADTSSRKDIHPYDALSGCLYSITRNTDYKYALHKTCGQGHITMELFKDKTPTLNLEWATFDVDKDGREEIIINYQYIRGSGKGYSDFVTILSVK